MTTHFKNTSLFYSSEELSCNQLRLMKGISAHSRNHQGPSTQLLYCIWNYRESMTPWDVPERSQKVRDSYRKPWLCVCCKHTFYLSFQKLVSLAPLAPHPWSRPEEKVLSLSKRSPDPMKREKLPGSELLYLTNLIVFLSKLFTHFLDFPATLCL